MGFKKAFTYGLAIVFSLGTLGVLSSDVDAKNGSVFNSKSCYKVVKTTKTKYKNGKIKTKTQTLKGTNKGYCEPYKGKIVRTYNKKGQEIKMVAQEYYLDFDKKVKRSTKVTYSKYKKSGKYWGYTAITVNDYEVSYGKNVKTQVVKTKTLPNGKKVTENRVIYDWYGKKVSSYTDKYNSKGKIIQSITENYENGKKKESFNIKYDSKGEMTQKIELHYDTKGKIVSGNKTIYTKDKTYYYEWIDGKWVLS